MKLYKSTSVAFVNYLDVVELKGFIGFLIYTSNQDNLTMNPAWDSLLQMDLSETFSVV